MPYHPPFTMTPRLIDLVSRISEGLGRWTGEEAGMSPRLRQENRIQHLRGYWAALDGGNLDLICLPESMRREA